MNRDSKIYISGHTGTAGSAILKKLISLGYTNIIYKSHSELDLTDYKRVDEFFSHERPEYVFFTAAKMIPIGQNNKADILYENTLIQNNIIHSSYKYKAKKMISLGSSWMYPESSVNPIKEKELFSSYFNKHAEPYALSKAHCAKMIEYYNMDYGTQFIFTPLTNLYGPCKELDLNKSRVFIAMMRKMHLAKLYFEDNFDGLKKDTGLYKIDEIISFLNINGIFKDRLELWGTGNTRREFLFSEDLADACIFLMNANIDFQKNSLINIGTGVDVTIKELSEMMSRAIKYNGKIIFDASKPDSNMNRLLDISNISKLGWKCKTNLDTGIQIMYDWYIGKDGI